MRRAPCQWREWPVAPSQPGRLRATTSRSRRAAAAPRGAAPALPNRPARQSAVPLRRASLPAPAGTQPAALPTHRQQSPRPTFPRRSIRAPSYADRQRQCQSPLEGPNARRRLRRAARLLAPSDPPLRRAWAESQAPAPGGARAPPRVSAPSLVQAGTGHAGRNRRTGTRARPLRRQAGYPEARKAKPQF